MNGVLLIAIAYPATIAVLFWLAFLRPVQQHQRKQREELASLRVGDEVLTQAGFIAVIKEIRVPEEAGPTELVLDLGGPDGRSLEVRAMASAVVQRLKPSPAAPVGQESAAVPERPQAVKQAQGSPHA